MKANHYYHIVNTSDCLLIVWLLIQPTSAEFSWWTMVKLWFPTAHVLLVWPLKCMFSLTIFFLIFHIFAQHFFHVLASFMSKPKFLYFVYFLKRKFVQLFINKKNLIIEKMVWLYFLLAHTLAPLVPARLFWKTGTAYGAKNMEIAPQGISNPKFETATLQLQVQRSTNWATWIPHARDMQLLQKI